MESPKPDPFMRAIQTRAPDLDEAIENLLQPVIGDPDACVPHANMHAVKKVDQDLLQLVRIGAHGHVGRAPPPVQPQRAEPCC